MSALPLPERALCFAEDFVVWILDGRKAATTRVDNFVLEGGGLEVVGDLLPGERVRAVYLASGDSSTVTITGASRSTGASTGMGTGTGKGKTETCFAVLEITRLESRTVRSVDDELARVENFESAAELNAALLRFYPVLTDGSELVVVHFKLLHEVQRA